MHEDEPFIRKNIPALLLARDVKTKTDAIQGQWQLHEDEINYIHPMPSNIEFAIVLVNGSSCLRVSAKINRQTARLSNIEAEEV